MLVNTNKSYRLYGIAIVHYPLYLFWEIIHQIVDRRETYYDDSLDNKCLENAMSVGNSLNKIQ